MKKIVAKKITKALNETDLIQQMQALMQAHGLNDFVIDGLAFRPLDAGVRRCQDGSIAQFVFTKTRGFIRWCPEDGPIPP